MSTQFDYRATPPHPAAAMFAAMVDADCLRARLAALGGRDAALLEHEANADGARFRVRHSLDPSDIPQAVRPFLPSNFAIHRLETWRRAGEGRYTGTAHVEVPGTPASASGRMGLHDAGSGSELRISTDVSVNVPLIGSRIEGSVGQQILQLLDMETAFTLDWMSRNG